MIRDEVPRERGIGLSRRRQSYGMAVAILGVPMLTAIALPWRESLGLDTVLLAFVLVSVTASVVGGVVPAIVASLMSVGFTNFFFAPPYGTFVVSSPSEILDLLVFLAVAVLVGVITDAGARSRARTERNRLRAEWLTGLDAVPSGVDPLDAVLAEVQRTFGVDAVRLTDGAEILASCGSDAPQTVSLSAPAGDGLCLQLSGPEQVGVDRGLLESLARTAGRLWRTKQLSETARRAEELARIDELRAALLAAVGHDLRVPLATIRTAVATLAEPNLALAPDETSELLAAIDQAAERLNAIIVNLLDLSRLQAGVLSVHLAPTDVAELLDASLGCNPDQAILTISDHLPLAKADAGLLERVLANLIDNAGRFEPKNSRLEIEASAHHGFVVIAVVDHGPGISRQRYQEVFQPFQRFQDRTHEGIGLGLAIARGFVEAMGGTLSPSPTPGGGLTMTLTLEVSGATHIDR